MEHYREFRYRFICGKFCCNYRNPGIGTFTESHFCDSHFCCMFYPHSGCLMVMVSAYDQRAKRKSRRERQQDIYSINFILISGRGNFIHLHRRFLFHRNCLKGILNLVANREFSNRMVFKSLLNSIHQAA